MTQKIKRTITIPDGSYQHIKDYCKESGLKISWLAEKVLLSYIEQQKDKINGKK